MSMANWRDEWPMQTAGEALGYAAAGLSAAQIGTRIGATRNAVIGKVHRMGGRLCGGSGGVAFGVRRGRYRMNDIWDETRLTQPWRRS